MTSGDKTSEEKVEAPAEEKKQENKEENKEEKTEDKKDAAADPLQEFMDEGRKEQAANAPNPAVGEIYECRFVHPKGDRWFEAKVLEIVEKDGEEKKYKMEWQYDPDEEKSIVSVSDLRKVPSKETEKKAEAPAEEKEDTLEPKVGDIFEARFANPKGDRWFEAKVLEIVKEGDEDKYKMEWQYDPDEEKSILPLADLRKVGSAKAAGAGAKQGGAKPWEGKSKSWEPETKKRKVEYVVSDTELEKRKKRAARFGVPEEK